jgi:hypothetical protein
MSARWWDNNSDERYWLEATDRDDLGADLHAPAADSAGRDNWRYTLFREAAPGDIVFHYNGKANAIVARSVIAGPHRPIMTTWAARGSYARARKAEAVPLAGYSVPLRDYEKLATPLTLDAIRAARPELDAVIATLRARHGKAPLYFPFELSARPVRPMQGYAFKLPAAVVELFALEPPTSREPFTISADSSLVARSFAKWREALLEGAVRERGLWRQPAERFVFTNQPARGSTQLGKRTALGVDPTGATWAVQINEADTPGDLDVTAAIATDSSGRAHILRQGRLNPNSQSPKPVLYEEFRRLSGLVPARVTNGDTTIPRDWYVVTALDLENSVIRQKTADFVDACVMVRTGGRGAGSPEDLKRAGELSGNDETGGSYKLGAKPAIDEREIKRRQGEIWQRMAMLLRGAGASVEKVRHADGYEIDAEIVNGRRRLLVEIKTGTSAGDVYAGLGQLMLYAKLFPRLAGHTPVLLLPGRPGKALAQAVTECGVRICTFEADFNAAPVPVSFSREFLKRCGLLLAEI